MLVVGRQLLILIDMVHTRKQLTLDWRLYIDVQSHGLLVR